MDKYGKNVPAYKVKQEFGEYAIDNEGKITISTNKDEIKDWILRHEGLQKALWNHHLIISALGGVDEKAKYIAYKREDLGRIADNVKQIFKMEFTRFLRTGMAKELAQSKATKSAETYKANLMKAHDKQFPEELKHETVMRMLKVGGKSDK